MSEEGSTERAGRVTGTLCLLPAASFLLPRLCFSPQSRLISRINQLRIPRLSFCHPLLPPLPCLPSQNDGQEPTGKCKVHLNLLNLLYIDRSMGPMDTSSSRKQNLSHPTTPQSGFNQKPAADHTVALCSPRNTQSCGLMEPPPRSCTAQELQPGREPALHICSSVQDPWAPGLCVTEPSHPLSLPPSLPPLYAVSTAGCPGRSRYCCYLVH